MSKGNTMRTSIGRTAILAVVLAASGAGAAFAQQGQVVLQVRAPGAPSGEVFVEGGGGSIGREALQGIAERINPEGRQAVARNPQLLRDNEDLRALLTEELFSQALVRDAIAARVHERPEVRVAAEAAALNVITAAYLNSLTAPDPSYPSAQEVREFADARKTEVTLGQLFIPVPEGADAAAVESARQRAAALKARASASAAAFDQVAQEAVQSGQALGAAVGPRPLTAVPQELRGLVNRTNPGQTTEPFKGAQGWWVLRVEAKRQAEVQPLSDDQIRQGMRQLRQQELQNQWFAQRLRENPIRINDFAVAPIFQAQ